MTMLVVSDASALNILIRLGQADVLPALFEAVAIPPSVAEEMSRQATPEAVRDWMARPPHWLTVRSPVSPEPATPLRHRGERDAIRLAQELDADAILLDESKPRAEAAKLGLRVVGTVGVLELAANRGLIRDLAAVHDQLRQTNFFIVDQVLHASLARHRAARQPNRPRPTVAPTSEAASQHFTVFRFRPTVPRCFTFSMYATASGTLQAVSPMSTVTFPIRLAAAVASAVSGAT